MNISSKIRDFYNEFIKTESTPIKTLENQLYNSVEKGDLLEAEIIDNMQQRIKILLANGQVFEANLEKPIDVFIGQEVVLEVKEVIDNQVILSIYQNKSDVEQGGDLEIANLLKQLNVKSTEAAKQAVEILMDKTLPITKEAIETIVRSMESLDIPIETIIKMLDSKIPINQENVSQMKQYEDGQIKLETQLTKVLDQIIQIDNPEDLEVIYNKLIEIANRETTHQKPITQEPLPEKMLSSSEYKTPELKQFSKLEPFQLLDIESLNNPLTPKDLVTLKTTIVEVFKEQFFIKVSDFHKASDLQLEKINKIYKDTYELVDTLEKVEGKSSNQSKLEVYSDTKSNIEFLNTANKYDTMIQIPILLENQNKQGELYIFNRNKQGKQGKKDYKQSSMLISLETVNLGTVETYIRKDNNLISCQFKLDNKTVEGLVKNKITLLGELLKLKGYNLVSVKYLPKAELFNHKESEPKEPSTLKRYRFDTKV